MSLSIPRNYPGRIGPRGERRAMCDYCGIKFYRMAGNMRRDAAGFLACEECQPGRDVVTLDRANAAYAQQIRGAKPPPERW